MNSYKDDILCKTYVDESNNIDTTFITQNKVWGSTILPNTYRIHKHTRNFFNEMQMLVFILDVCSLCTDISLQKGKVFICKIDIGLQSIISVFYAQHRVILSSSSYQYHFHVFEIACYT